MSEKSAHQISGADVAWADLILVMDREYKTRIAERFRGLALPRIESLDIPDDYGFMDEELVKRIEEGMNHYFQLMQQA
ncbi:hypothetical protein SDC9_83929 [bioreactor metagenome]|uniref:Phosphotyrosine protein phosphatase I domain-containing protein n=1 Tax=bioreactor metagenome TaxID=1076179 RepID=A0A644Z9H2_9ZZZZ